MRFKRLAAAVTILLFLLPACSSSDKLSAETGTRIYYYARPNEDHPDLVALSYEWYAIPESIDNTALQCDLVLKALKNPTVDGHESILPPDMFPTCELIGKRARVEVGVAYAALSRMEQSMVMAAISLSLLELDGVRYVAITVEDQEQRLLGNYIAAEHIVLDDDIFNAELVDEAVSE